MFKKEELIGFIDHQRILSRKGQRSLSRILMSGFESEGMSGRRNIPRIIQSGIFRRTLSIGVRRGICRAVRIEERWKRNTVVGDVLAR